MSTNIQCKGRVNYRWFGVYRSELDDRSNEIVALRSTIAASEELEEKQAGTIKNLTISVDRLEKDIIATRNVYDESKSKISSLQSALDSAYKELADLHRQHATQEGQVHETLVSTEIAAREELRQALEQQKLQLSRDQEELLERLEVLQVCMVLLMDLSGCPVQTLFGRDAEIFFFDKKSLRQKNICLAESQSVVYSHFFWQSDLC